MVRASSCATWAKMTLAKRWFGHLVDIGSIPNTIAAERIVASAPIESVGVVW